MKKRFLAMLLVTLFLLAAFPLTAGASGPADKLAGMPYYGDSARCKMPPEMALAYAKVLREMPEPQYTYDGTFYPEAFLADPAGDGMPVLVTACLKTETDRDMVDWLLSRMDTDTVKEVWYGGDHVDVWAFRDGSAYKALDYLGWHSHFGAMEGKGLITSFGQGLAIGDTVRYNFYSVSNGVVELAHRAEMKTECLRKDDTGQIAEFQMNGWQLEEDGDEWQYWCRYILDGENVTREAMALDAHPFVSAMLDYRTDRPIAVSSAGRDFLAQPAVSAERLAAALEAYAAAAVPTAVASTQAVELDGKKTLFQMYALLDENGYQTNYVKLRDVAYALNGTAAQFNVIWTPEAGVQVITGAAYQPDGSEMSTPFTGDRAYTVVEDATTVDGAAVRLDAIRLTDDNGNGYTYYKLRDLGEALGFHVDWSSDRGVFVETDKYYGGEPKQGTTAADDWKTAYLTFLSTWRPGAPNGYDSFYYNYDVGKVTFADFDMDGVVEMQAGFEVNAGAGFVYSRFFDLDADGRVVDLGHEDFHNPTLCWDNQTQQYCWVLYSGYEGSYEHNYVDLIGRDEKGMLTFARLGDFDYGDMGGGPYWLNGQEVDKATLEAAEQAVRERYVPQDRPLAVAGGSWGESWGPELWQRAAEGYTPFSG